MIAFLKRLFKRNPVDAEVIYKFALSLMQNSEDIPEEFAKIINDDFWELLSS